MYRSLLIILLVSLWHQVEPVTAGSRVMLMLDGELDQVDDHVLDLGVSVAAGLSAELVEPSDLVEEVVDDGQDDGDGDGVTPDDDDGDDGGSARVGEDGVVKWIIVNL